MEQEADWWLYLKQALPYRNQRGKRGIISPKITLIGLIMFEHLLGEFFYLFIYLSVVFECSMLIFYM